MIDGVIIVEDWARNFGDSRGFFRELGRNTKFKELGLPDMVQFNLAKSSKNVVRGLHFQELKPQGKFVQCIEGEIIDVIVDMRSNSETFGNVQKIRINNNNAVYVPPYCAHGYWSLEDNTIVHYAVTEYYNYELDRGFCPLDDSLDLPWNGVEGLLFSDKDKNNPFFQDEYNKGKGFFNF